MTRAPLLLAAPAVLCLTLAACSAAPQDMTVHGMVELTSVNGVPPAQAYPAIDGNLTVNITADDGPGNYEGQPWNGATTMMTLQSSTAKMTVYTFTAQVPGDAGTYQISAICCFLQGEPAEGGSFTLEQMQQGPVLCIGDGCPP